MSESQSHRVPPYRRPIIVIGCLALLITVVVIVVVVLSLQHPKTSTGDDSASPEIPVATPLEPESENPSENPDDEIDESINPQQVPQFEGENPNQLPDLTGYVAYQGIDRDLGELTITATINQFITSGTCTLNLLNTTGANVYSADQPIAADVSTSYCGPFEIPISNLASGSYDIKINIKSSDKTGIITDVVQL